MSVAVGGLNVVLGLVYTSYGIMTWIDLRRGWSTNGPSHFGVAWLLMAFTCGPHHLDHGLHLLTTQPVGGWIEFVTIAVGFPAGVTWFLLRVEAMRGGRGDRPIEGTPWWVEALPTLGAVYLVAIVTATVGIGTGSVTGVRSTVIPNLLLVALYTAIGLVLLRTQLANHRSSGNWSLSGLALTAVFPTCALMHGAWALYATTGRYEVTGHLLAVDVLAVPAAAYFLWVVWSLSRGVIHDWNEAASDSTRMFDDVLEELGAIRA
jgi:hypothetical protein